MFKKCLFSKENRLLRWVEGGFWGVFPRRFFCKKRLRGRKSASNVRLNELVDYIMLLKSLEAPNMERKSTDFTNKREVVSTFFVKQQLQSA